MSKLLGLLVIIWLYLYTESFLYLVLIINLWYIITMLQVNKYLIVALQTNVTKIIRKYINYKINCHLKIVLNKKLLINSINHFTEIQSFIEVYTIRWNMVLLGQYIHKNKRGKLPSPLTQVSPIHWKGFCTPVIYCFDFILDPKDRDLSCREEGVEWREKKTRKRNDYE